MIKPYYQTKLGKLYCGDCREVLHELSDKTAHLTFTSPPYNTGNIGKNKDMYSDYKDNLKEEEYTELLRCSIAESMRVTNGLVMFNVNYMRNNQYSLDFISLCFSDVRKEKIIWDKGRVQPPISNILGKRYEEIWVFTDDNNYEINNFKDNKAKNHTNVFGNWISNLITLSIKDDQTEYCKINRAGFPLSLPKIFIDIYTREEDTVLDPFFGLGTTAIACEKMNRKWIGIELTEKCCETAVNRIEAAIGQQEFNL